MLVLGMAVPATPLPKGREAGVGILLVALRGVQPGVPGSVVPIGPGAEKRSALLARGGGRQLRFLRQAAPTRVQFFGRKLHVARPAWHWHRMCQPRCSQPDQPRPPSKVCPRQGASRSLSGRASLLAGPGAGPSHAEAAALGR